MTDRLMHEGYEKAVSLLRTCSTPDGFVSSPSDQFNYRRIWGRDGSIISIAALLTGDEALIDSARQTLGTLAGVQGPHGEIPSNFDPVSDRISYLRAVHRGNALEMKGEAWSFPEYVHGRELTAGGTRHQGWSAAGAIIGHHALAGNRAFRIDRGQNEPRSAPSARGLH